MLIDAGGATGASAVARLTKLRPMLSAPATKTTATSAQITPRPMSCGTGRFARDTSKSAGASRTNGLSSSALLACGAPRSSPRTFLTICDALTSDRSPSHGAKPWPACEKRYPSVAGSPRNTAAAAFSAARTVDGNNRLCRIRLPPT